MTEPIVKKSQLKLWFLIPLIVFIGLIIMLFFRLNKPTEVVINNALNREVPSFELPLLTDITQTVSNDSLPNDPYLINIWGSWCPSCVVEHPFLLQLKQNGVQIVGVNYDDELEDALEYLQTRDDPYVFSIQDQHGALAVDLGLTGAPETFVIDGKGNIRQHIVGVVNEDNWQQRIAPCLNLLDQIAVQNDDLASQTVQTDIAKVCV